MDREQRESDRRRRPRPADDRSPERTGRTQSRPRRRTDSRSRPMQAPPDSEELRHTAPFQGGQKSSKAAAKARRHRAEQQDKRRKQRRKARQAERQREQTRRDPVKPLNRRGVVIKLVTMLAVVLALTLGMTIFFKIQVIQVTGSDKYTVQEIVDASGVEIGENLLTFGKSSVAGRILTRLPYVESVQVGIKLPDTVNIEIVELSASFALEDTEGQWWLTDGSGKILEQTDPQKAERYIRITGIKILPADVGERIRVADDSGEQEETGYAQELTGNAAERAAAALTIMETLAKNDRSGNITIVDVTRLYDLQIWYGETYQVLLSGPADLSYKVRYMINAVEYLTQEGYYGGILDLASQESGKAVFTPW